MDFTICFQIQLNLMIGECELMWSKTRKSLNNRLADSLKKQVSYSFESYVINRHELPVFKIVVNKKTWFMSNLFLFNVSCSTQNKLMKTLPPGMTYYEKCVLTERKASEITIHDTGLADVDMIMKYIHEFLNVISVDECLSGKNYFHYLLSLLDRRVGKRRIKTILENINNEPEWIRRFIILRAEAEKIL